MSDKWISVKDRLPTIYQDVSIAVKGSDKKMFTRAATFYKDCWVGTVSTYKLKQVTHWQPLPPPPGEVGS